MTLKLQLLPESYAVCRMEALPVRESLPDASAFYSLTITAEEVSLVCLESEIPAQSMSVERHWRIIKVLGPLEFSLTGVIAGISACLAKAGISIFTLSTFDTDYIMVKQDKLGGATASLKKAGYGVEQ